MRSFAKLSVAAGAGLLLALAAPLATSAHVTVSPNVASADSYALVTFKVPNESATATTVKIEADFPTDTPFSSVSYVPVSGWSAELVTETLPKPVKIGENEITEAVTKIVWTADPGVGVSAGQLQLFPVSLGPVPDVGSVVFTVNQTYSDGTVVSWSETATDSNHPAPVLYVNDPPPGDHHAADGGDDHATAGGESVDHAATPAGSASDPIARGLGISGLVLGAIGLVAAIVVSRRKTEA